MANDLDSIKRIVKEMRNCRSILFITGAGISADSGLPTYRGIGGLYTDKVTDDGIPVEEALAGETLRHHPEITWKYLLQIEQNCRNATCNRGHAVIAEMEKYFGRVWVLTQNIDGFHYAAGSRNVIDIHGDMHRLLCTRCYWHETVKDYSAIGMPPQCPECKSAVRPDVVFFGELLEEKKIALLRRELDRGFDMYFSIGTTSIFPYISQPMVMARHLAKPTIEINPAETEISASVDVRLRMRAAEALDAIWSRYLTGT